MKKLYKAPTASLHNVEVRHMFCGSDPNSLTGETLGNDAQNEGNSDYNLSKEDFGW